MSQDVTETLEEAAEILTEVQSRTEAQDELAAEKDVYDMSEDDRQLEEYADQLEEELLYEEDEGAANIVLQPLMPSYTGKLGWCNKTCR